MFSQPWGKATDYDLNIGLILGRRYNYVIDTGLGSDSIMPILDYIGSDTKPIVAINTHWHWDHILGNIVFKNGLILSHALCHRLMDKHWDEIVRDCGEYFEGEVYKCLPNMVFEGNISFPEDNIIIFHTPGHTADGISIYDAEDGVLWAGDNIGDTDDEIVPWLDTDDATFRHTIEAYKQYEFDICISGHNKPQKKDVILRMETALPNAWKKQNEAKQK